MCTLSGLMRRRLLAGLLLALPLPAAAQTNYASKKAPTNAAKPAVVPETVYEAYQLQIKPEYAAGQFALQQYLKSARLPTEVKEGRVQGAVYVSFVVRPSGRLTDVFVTRGLSAATNAEALRLIQAMPNWRPGRRDEQAVGTRYALEVRFQKPVESINTTTVKGGDLMELSGEGNRVVEEVVENKAYTYVEQMPEFPGGNQAMINYIQNNLKYPAQARQEQVEGRMFVAFVVEKDGNVSDVKVQKGLGSGCDEEAVRVIKSLPRFEPGKQNGRTVLVAYTVPVTFSLAAPATTGAVPAPVEPEDKVYTYVEQMPTIPGASNMGSISTALQAAVVLPAEVREGKSEGQIHINFVVHPDGSTSDAKVVRSLCPACDQAALAAVKALPHLAPGKQNGKKVSVQLTVPVVMYGPNHVFEYHQVATQAAFPGNETALRQYLTEKLREPKVLKQENLAGAVEVRFVVQTDGKIGAAEVVRPLCRSCDEEALRLIRNMPRWTPARNAADQPVSVRQSLRIRMPAVPATLRGRTGKVYDSKSVLKFTSS